MSKHKTKPIIIKINKLYLRLRDNFDNNNKITFFPFEYNKRNRYNKINK